MWRYANRCEWHQNKKPTNEEMMRASRRPLTTLVYYSPPNLPLHPSSTVIHLSVFFFIIIIDAVRASWSLYEIFEYVPLFVGHWRWNYSPFHNRWRCRRPRRFHIQSRWKSFEFKPIIGCKWITLNESVDHWVCSAKRVNFWWLILGENDRSG